MTSNQKNHLPNHFSNFFDDFFSRDLYNWSRGNTQASKQSFPATNILETPEAFRAEVVVPGFNKKDFNITLENNLLTISANRDDANEQTERTNYIRREFFQKSFQRSFQLSQDVVNPDQIEAHYENGILSLRIPKREEAKEISPRMIEIS